METRIEYRQEGTWNVPFSERLIKTVEESVGVYGTSNPERLKKNFPELTLLLEQPAGTKLEVNLPIAAELRGF